MNRTKVSALSLYIKDLKANNAGKFMDKITAADKFKKLSIQDRDHYEVAAKRINSQITSEPVFTKQKDTLGNNLKEIGEISDRRSDWEKKARNLINDIVDSENVLNKIFYTVKISGVDFCRSEDNKRVYATSEICLIKFSFMKGIIDQIILFPDIINVAAGYRQHLYEDLEENVGWKPETFRNNHSIRDTIIAIRNFFNGNYEPIYVPIKDNQEEVGLAFQTLYDEVKMSCPWIECYEDWGRKCQIYQLEHLVASILKKYSDDNEETGVSVVLDFWRKLRVEMAPETCERHLQYGLSNQCCTNMLLKYLYGSFSMLQFDGKPDLQHLVSEDFFKELDFIVPMDNAEDSRPVSVQPPTVTISWNNYFFDHSNIEDVISSFSGIDIRNDIESTSNNNKGDWGRGRGMVRRLESNANIPGSSGSNKIKLPKVVC